MTTPRIVSQEEWLKARKAFLAKEKEFTRARDELARQRRELPWVKVERPTPSKGRRGGSRSADLFGGKGQLMSTTS